MNSPIKGRGSAANPEGRYIVSRHEAEHDGWFVDGEPAAPPRTTVTAETARSIVSYNDSPDLGFDRSINPYRGCEHGCSYCYARPSHSYLELSPGLDFETRLFAKQNAPELLRAALARPGYSPQPISLGANTDPYQPIEREWRLTRQLIEVLAECSHPFTIVTKNALVERDLDLLAPLAARRLVKVYLSVTTLDNRLAARMEPRASAPRRRVEAIARLHAAGVPVGILVAPVIPMLNDPELEAILEACRDAGAQSAAYVLLRMPHEMAQLFEDWLRMHYPQRADHILSLMRQLHGGKAYDARFGRRQTGAGPFAQLLQRRFALAHQRLGYADVQEAPLDLARFRAPRPASPQGELF
jgi:DNA repair photolyase